MRNPIEDTVREPAPENGAEGPSEAVEAVRDARGPESAEGRNRESREDDERKAEEIRREVRAMPAPHGAVELPKLVESGAAGKELEALMSHASERELGIINRKVDTFIEDGIGAGVANLRSLLTEEDIQASDRAQIESLETKQQRGSLSPEEQLELDTRKRGRLLGQTYESKDVQAAGSVLRLGYAPAYKEAYFLKTDIEGVQDGAAVSLRRSEYPDFTDAENLRESRRADTFFGSDWKGKKRYAYEGSVNGAALEPQAAEALFARYSGVAQKRMEEIKALKQKRELEKNGRILHGKRYRWEHEIVDTSR